MAKAKENIGTGNIGFEDQLWNAACKLWGGMSPANYQNVALGLVFLKYVSERFNERYSELVEEGEGFENEEDEYTRKNIFYVPEEARWEEIVKHAGKPDIGQAIDNAMVAIENKHKNLKDVLPKNYASPDINKTNLGDVVEEFSNIMMVAGEKDRDVLGRTYEYFINKFSDLAGKGGEFFTPPCIVKTLVGILKPYKGHVYDPCCGSGGMFVQSELFIDEHAGNFKKNVSVIGQEKNPATKRLCRMNLAIRGIEADLGPDCEDMSTFSNDLHPYLKSEFIMANPPFNLHPWGGNNLTADKRWVYGVPSDSNANYAWIQHMIYHLDPTVGKAGFVLANGSLSSNQNNDGVIRQNIINADLVEGIIAMPAKLFYTVTIPVCLWFISKGKKQKGKTLFIDARKLGHNISRTQIELSQEDIDKLVGTFESFQKGEDIDEQGFAKVASLDDIKAQDYILTPGRYVGIEEQQEDDEPFEEKMSRLTSELSDLLMKSHELEDEIRKQLGSIGYEI